MPFLRTNDSSDGLAFWPNTLSLSYFCCLHCFVLWYFVLWLACYIVAIFVMPCGKNVKKRITEVPPPRNVAGLLRRYWFANPCIVILHGWLDLNCARADNLNWWFISSFKKNMHNITNLWCCCENVLDERWKIMHVCTTLNKILNDFRMINISSWLC